MLDQLKFYPDWEQSRAELPLAAFEAALHTAARLLLCHPKAAGVY